MIPAKPREPGFLMHTGRKWTILNGKKEGEGRGKERKKGEKKRERGREGEKERKGTVEYNLEQNGA